MWPSLFFEFPVCHKTLLLPRTDSWHNSHLTILNCVLKYRDQRKDRRNMRYTIYGLLASVLLVTTVFATATEFTSNVSLTEQPLAATWYPLDRSSVRQSPRLRSSRSIQAVRLQRLGIQLLGASLFLSEPCRWDSTRVAKNCHPHQRRNPVKLRHPILHRGCPLQVVHSPGFLFRLQRADSGGGCGQDYAMFHPRVWL